MHIDNVALAATYNAAWRRGRQQQRGDRFSVASRDAVDHLYRTLTEDEGYEGRQVPYDAFWGARYAIVADPNGIDVGIMSPSDEPRRSSPAPSPDE